MRDAQSNRELSNADKKTATEIFTLVPGGIKFTGKTRGSGGKTSIPDNNVLVVDDSPTSRLKLAAAVRHLGHNVLEADGGRERNADVG